MNKNGRACSQVAQSGWTLAKSICVADQTKLPHDEGTATCSRSSRSGGRAAAPAEASAAYPEQR
jgi:hypothetical protein